MRLKSIALLAGACLSMAASPSMAGTLSFAGTFTQDDNLQIVAFTTFAAGAVTLETYSYAGGIDPTGKSIAGGGFDPVFGLFDASGALLQIGDDGATRVDSVTGAAFDAAVTTQLAAGTYFIALSQFDKYPNGPLFSSGFSENGTGNFTAAFGCSAGRFCDLTGSSRTGAYDIAITGSGITTPVPEPSSFAMLALALAGFALTGQVKRRWSNQHQHDAATGSRIIPRG